MTAQELLNDRLKQEQADYQTSFQREWQIANQRFGPVSNNPRIEDARRRALSTLHQQWAARADALTRSYNKKIQGMQEVDRVIENPVKADEVKMRLIEPTEVEKVLFPQPEKETDPLKAYDQLYLHGQKVEEKLKRFETEGPSSVKVRRGGLLGLVPGFAGRRVEVPGGGTKIVTERTYNRSTGKWEKKSRNATPEEIRQWAALKAEQERVSQEEEKLLADIRRSDHTAVRMRMAAAASPRMGGGTFATKAVQPKKQEEPKRSNNDPLGLGL